MKIVKFTLPDKCAIKTIHIRETNGVDEQQAELAAEGSGVSEAKELIALSIVAVDDGEVTPGLTGFRAWPTKTRQVVERLSKRLNGFELSKLAPLIEEAEEENTETVDGRMQTKYKFPAKGKDEHVGCDLKWVILQEMMESDERAASTAKPENIEDEALRLCIVKTNLEDSPTIESIRKLNSKTRIILKTYWNGMNFVEDDELLPLAIAAEVVAAEAEKASVAGTDSESLENGSGSPMEADAA